MAASCRMKTDRRNAYYQRTNNIAQGARPLAGVVSVRRSGARTPNRASRGTRSMSEEATDSNENSGTALGEQSSLSFYSQQSPVEYYVQYKQGVGGSESTVEAYDRVLTEFEAFVDSRGSSLSQASGDDLTEWVGSLRERGLSNSTVWTYYMYVRQFYEHLVNSQNHRSFEHDPTAVMRETVSERSDSDPDRRDISLVEMREFVGSVANPLDRAVLTTLLKTGIRVGTLCDINMCEVHLPDSDPIGPGDETAQEFDAQHEVECEGYLHIPAAEKDRRYGKEASSKRSHDTLIPIDGELAEALIVWAYIRPDPLPDGQPLFLSTGAEWGRQLSPPMVRKAIEQHARPAGWYETGDGVKRNVTPHYFRHFFTTVMRQRSGDTGLIEYLRGDVGGNIVDTYTHGWGDEYQKRYIEHIYSVFSSDSERGRPAKYSEVRA